VELTSLPHAARVNRRRIEVVCRMSRSVRIAVVCAQRLIADPWTAALSGKA
jgi:hypothetical protein